MEPLEGRVLLATLYVDSAAPGPDIDGQSWSTAYQNIQSAFAVAQGGDEILVATGQYDTLDTFQLINGVALRGGYAGHANPANPDVRNTTLYPTALVQGYIYSNGGPAVVTATDVSATTVLDGFTIRNSSGINGGGMYILRGGPTIRNCIFRNNRATYGGGLYNDHAAPALIDCSFTDNTITAYNSQTGEWYVTHGGGVYNNASTPQFTNCTFTGNNAGAGGAMYNASSTVTLNDCEFTSNSAYYINQTSIVTMFGGKGGAIYNTASSVTLEGCSFFRNKTPTNAGYTHGGAVYNEYSSPLTAINCVLADNEASLGGAFYGDSISLVNCTVNSNGANAGRALHSEQFPSSITVVNSILWGPSTAQVFGDGMNITYSNIHGGYPGAGNIDASPQFVRDTAPGPDANWNTEDDDFGDLHLQLTSPTIDAGNSSALPAGLTEDKDGRPRSRDIASVGDTGIGGAPIVDMGAYEAADTIAPAMTINQASSQADPTDNTLIYFRVVFSEAVTGFSTGDVSLSGTAGATTAAVTGSGTTYNIAVGGMSRSGTVIASILAGVATDASGNANTASTSTDNVVTYSRLTRMNNDGGTDFASAGKWKTVKQGYGQNLRYDTYPNQSGDKASWAFTGLSAGMYRVAVTWVPGTNRATNANYSVWDNNAVKRGSVAVNQRIAPSGVVVKGVGFRVLGTYPVTSSKLVVWLQDTRANGYVIADAVWIERVSSLVPASAVAPPAAVPFSAVAKPITQAVASHGSISHQPMAGAFSTSIVKSVMPFAPVWQATTNSGMGDHYDDISALF